MPTNNSGPLVLSGKQDGLTLIPRGTPLTRLNYFDGKFLRAADLRAEQEYQRRLVQMSNEAGGPGVAHGFDLKLGGDGDTLYVGPGLAIDPQGRVLLLTFASPVNIEQLIEQSRSKSLASNSAVGESAGGAGFAECESATAAPTTEALLPGDLYLVSVAWAEGYCGEEEVFGRLCEEACSAGTDRPYLVEGLVLRATPLQLKTLPATSKAVSLTQAHRRSLVASAYFEDERGLVVSLISGAGLRSDVWCFGAEGASGTGVPLGLIARAGKSTLFLDAWTARRERIDPPAKRYWQWRMRMRPWDVFLAQVLQFQCQLADAFGAAPPPGRKDPCDDAHKLVAEASDALSEITKIYERIATNLPGLVYGQHFDIVPFTGGVEGLNSLQQRLRAAKEAHLLAPSNRLLINGGIVELPSAGYLPVAPSESLSVNEQVSLMMGEGVDLRFCVVRPDYVAHAFEAAQHLERISLLEGLDDPQKRQEVDVLVPDGVIVEEKPLAPGGFEAEFNFSPDVADLVLGAIVRRIFSSVREVNVPSIRESVPFQGAARGEVLADGGRAFRVALLLDTQGFGGVRSPSDIHTPFASKSSRPAATSAGSMGAEEAEAAGANDTDAGVKVPSSNKRLFKHMASGMRRAGQPPKVETRGGGEEPAAATRGAEEAPSIKAASIKASAAPVWNIEGGIWLTMSCDKDPAQLKAGQTMRVDGRFVAGGVGSIPSLEELVYLDGRLQADALILEAKHDAGKHLVKCQVSVFGSAITKLKWKNSDAAVINVNAEIRWEEMGGDGGIEVVVRIPDENDGGGPQTLRFIATWGNQPREVKASLEITDERPGETGAPRHVLLKILTTHLRSNPEVLEASNERHVKALKALQVLGKALNDAGFYGTSVAALFPPPPTPSAELVVRGTRDWVLFHRRRAKRCGAQPPAAAATRRYRVYELRTQRDDPDAVPETPPTEAEIIRNAPLFLREAILVGEVSFGGGVSTILGDTSALRSGWKGEADDWILWGGIASQGDAQGEGDVLARERGRAVAALLDKVAPTARIDVLPIVPPGLGGAGLDGVLIFINGPSATTYYRKYGAAKGIGEKNL